MRRIGYLAVCIVVALAVALLSGVSGAAEKKKKKAIGPGKARWDIKTTIPAFAIVMFPRDVDLQTLLAIRPPPGAKGHSRRMDHMRYPQAPNAAGLTEGDIIRVRGWIHLVAAEPDGDYHIQVAQTKNSQARCFIVEVPRPTKKFVKDDDRVLHAAAMVREAIRMAAELVRRRVAVIATIRGPPAAFAAKAATTTIPIVFLVGEDPARLGLVASLARPGGNLTGVNFFNTELAAKRLELLRELVPTAKSVAVLVNPAEATNTESVVRDAEGAVRAMGLQIQVLNASTSREIDAAFATVVRERPDALFVGPGPFFTARRVQLALLAAIHRVPAIYPGRQYVEAGALMSYGASLADSCRQVGVYVGRILKGAKPADLPVLQSSKFELVINHQTARSLGLEVPTTLLASADEVIE